MHKMMAGAVQINKKVTLLGLAGLGVVLYLMYSWRRTSVSVSGMSNHDDVWNSLPNQLPAEHKHLVEIPKDILISRNDVKIKEEYLKLTVGDPVEMTIYLPS